MSEVDLRKVVEMVGGEPVVKFVDMEKGDLPGHDFHGNQWTTASAGAEVQRLKEFHAAMKAKGAPAAFLQRTEAKIAQVSAIHEKLKAKEAPKASAPTVTSHSNYNPRAEFMSRPGEQAKQRRVSQSAYSSSFGGDASNYTR